MIPAIGLMMGAYIFTRMIQLLSRADVNILAKVCAVITLLIVAFGCFVLLKGPAPGAIPRF